MEGRSENLVELQLNIKLSFIIPAYNCEVSLFECVDIIENNIQKQNKVSEVLIIENGSTDNTWEVAEKLKEKYSNILLFKSRKGVSSARNRGIEESTGCYIIFIDTDDKWIKSSCDKILKHLKSSDCDLLMCGYDNSCYGLSAVRRYSTERQWMYLKSLMATSRDIEDESNAVKSAYTEYVFAHFNLITVYDIYDLQIEDLFWKKYKNMKKLIKEPIFEKVLREISLRKCLAIQLPPEACIKCHHSIMGVI